MRQQEFVIKSDIIPLEHVYQNDGNAISFALISLNAPRRLPCGCNCGFAKVSGTCYNSPLSFPTVNTVQMIMKGFLHHTTTLPGNLRNAIVLVKVVLQKYKMHNTAVQRFPVQNSLHCSTMIFGTECAIL
ncbi:hypothetical protein GQX74_010595 [Glossina fuscipes]|nr:hypothetical protein GQX74_010595 [Glossina fuscipes]